MSDTTADKLAKFEELVQEHDVTFAYSDDVSMYRRGRAQRDEIEALAKELPLADVQRIWNARMDQYFVKEMASNWYWKG